VIGGAGSLGDRKLRSAHGVSASIGRIKGLYRDPGRGGIRNTFIACPVHGGTPGFKIITESARKKGHSAILPRSISAKRDDNVSREGGAESGGRNTMAFVDVLQGGHGHTRCEEQSKTLQT